MNKNRFAFVLLLGGKGERFGGKKQFLSYQDKPLYMHNLLFAYHSHLFSSYVLCLLKEDFSKVKSEVEKEGIPFVSYAYAGETRSESAYHALKEVNEADYVFIHDAARPLKDIKVLLRLKENVLQEGGAIPTLNVPDSVIFCEEKENKNIYLKREGVKLVQTPQAFSYRELMKIEEDLGERRREYSDEGSMYLAYEKHLGLVEGSIYHQKITTQEDLLWFGAISK